MSRGLIPGRGKRFFSQTGSGAHPISYSMDTGGSIPWIKLEGRGADRSAPSSVKVKNGGAIPPLAYTSP
jgi:hypothetical protein